MITVPIVACDPLLSGDVLPGSVNLFRRHPEDKSNPVEERPTPVDPSPLPETPPPRTVTPISLSPLDEANLSHALHHRVNRVLKDLLLNGPGANIPAIVGGAGQPFSAKREQPPGPIV